MHLPKEFMPKTVSSTFLRLLQIQSHFNETVQHNTPQYKYVVLHENTFLLAKSVQFYFEHVSFIYVCARAPIPNEYLFPNEGFNMKFNVINIPIKGNNTKA